MARTSVLQIRLTPDEAALVAEKAAEDHRSISDWARLAVLSAAAVGFDPREVPQRRTR